MLVVVFQFAIELWSADIHSEVIDVPMIPKVQHVIWVDGLTCGNVRVDLDIM